MPRLMPRQIDADGNGILVSKIEALGLEVHLNKGLKEAKFDEHGALSRLDFNDNTSVQTDMLIVSCGIAPRDELARDAGLEMGARGGAPPQPLPFGTVLTMNQSYLGSARIFSRWTKQVPSPCPSGLFSRWTNHI